MPGGPSAQADSAAARLAAARQVSGEALIWDIR
jgi:hypothetical protein